MRKVFIQSLLKLASTDERVMLLTGDLGYLVLEEFIERFPKQFLNVGAAEQNMLGLATGLAESGFIPYVYSITPFAVLRPFEFIRNGPVHHKLPVRIVGVGQGVEYGFNGYSHFGLEDVGVLRTQPGMTIIAPADDAQTKTAIEKTQHIRGPIYFRLSKDSQEIPELAGGFEIGSAQQIGNGTDALLISSGAITREVLTAMQTLDQQGISSTVLVISCIAPPPVKDLLRLLATFRFAFTVESHYIIGGIGSLVAETAASRGLNVHCTYLGFDSILSDTLGGAGYIQERGGLSAAKIAEAVQKVLEKNE